ncbi:hypothetical protein MKX08_008569 [Trichoderma sp. CBMAI-0020]|nr:hypothetical protein MKX08_008569 [Trichoderma sp. CBMAI-0020]
MASVIVLIAAVAWALSSDHHGSNPGYSGNDQNDNKNHKHNNGRRADRRMHRIASRASKAATAIATAMSPKRSGSRSAAPAPPQPAPPYMNGEDMYHSSEAQGPVLGSYRDQVPAGAPDGYRWRDEQSFN